MNEKEIAEKMIKEARKVIDEAEAKLKELDKPEFKHGDFRVSGTGFWQLYLKEIGGGMRIASKHHLFSGNLGDYSIIDKPACSGNIHDYFDDLKRNAVDLEEFDGWYPSGENRMIVRLVGKTSGLVEFCIDKALFSADLDEAVKIHQKLGQLIATARRRNGNV